MDSAAFIARARSMVGRQIVYKLGAGGMKPDAETPANGAGECDCSGFVSWGLGISRFVRGVPWYDAQHNGEWLNTDAIVRDAKSHYGFFDEIDKPEVGCLIVFPKSKASPSAGHVGIVSSVTPDGDLRVIHCSSGNYARFGHAIEETGANVFMRPDLGTIFARCALVTEEVS